MIIAGVDGCTAGWVAAIRHADGSIAVAVFGHFADLVALRPGLVAVDMPVGLPDRIGAAGRAPERVLRPLLGARQSSVFSVPSRSAVYAPDYRSACEAALATSDPPRKVSKQCFQLFRRMQEVDGLLRGEPALAGIVHESHPEGIFAGLNGWQPLDHPKKVKSRPNPAGLEERRALLEAAGLPRPLLVAPPPRGAGADDVLDAFACLVLAGRIRDGRATPLPDPPGRDSHGLPVAIWVPASPPSRAAAARAPAVPREEPRMSLPVTPDLIRAAHGRIRDHIRRTPLLQADPDLSPGAAVTFKLECLQHSGSFKARGAFNNLLSRAAPAAGVTAASGGNHGAAVALAARRLGLPARIFVPEISSPVKIAAIRAKGADVVVGGARYADAQAACDRHAAESGALLVHPYDTVETIAGAGTVALEWEEDQKALGLMPLDTVLVAVGGGGLVSGVGAWWGGRVRVIAVEPEGSCCLSAAFAAGRPVDVPVDSIAADSLGAKRAGDVVFEVSRKTVERVVLVPDDSIRAAQLKLWRDWRIAAEPGGAAALAALLSGRYTPAPGERVGVLLCGANVDPASLAG